MLQECPQVQQHDKDIQADLLIRCRMEEQGDNIVLTIRKDSRVPPRLSGILRLVVVVAQCDHPWTVGTHGHAKD